MTTITVFKGDGIGPEITDAVIKVLNAANAKLEYEVFNVGAKVYEETGEYIPEKAFESYEKNKILLKSPITTPVGKGFRSLNVTLRNKYDKVHINVETDGTITPLQAITMAAKICMENLDYQI